LPQIGLENSETSSNGWSWLATRWGSSLPMLSACSQAIVRPTAWGIHAEIACKVESKYAPFGVVRAMQHLAITRPWRHRSVHASAALFE
jgi:hypothetical protein